MKTNLTDTTARPYDIVLSTKPTGIYRYIVIVCSIGTTCYVTCVLTDGL